MSGVRTRSWGLWAVSVYFLSSVALGAAAPSIENLGLGCDDSNCIWINAKNVDKNVRVLVSNKFNNQTNTYSRSMINFKSGKNKIHSITFPLIKSDIEALDKSGLRIVLKNSKGKSSNTWTLEARGSVPLPQVSPVPSQSRTVLSQSGLGCDDLKCLWIIGTQIEANVSVKIRARGSSRVPDDYSGENRRYFTHENGTQSVTLRLSALNVSELNSSGIEFWIVDSQNLPSNILTQGGGPQPSVSPAQKKYTQVTGGSNYAWYSASGTEDLNCSSWWSDHVIYKYQENKVEIQKNLKAMFDAGQRRLRLPLYHRRGPAGGAQFDSTGGTVPRFILDNTAALLKDVKVAGYEEIIFGFFPLAPNVPWEAGWKEEYLFENLAVIEAVRPLLTSSGLKYKIDLHNEAGGWTFDPQGNAATVNYMQRLWTLYTAKYGKADTLGFSLWIVPGTMANMDKVYGNNFPDFFDVHIYGGDQGNWPAEARGWKWGDFDLFYEQGHKDLEKMSQRLGRRFDQPWIIGETYFNDDRIVWELKRAVDKTGRVPYYILQWPVSRQNKCGNGHADVVPIQYHKYLNL